MPIVAHVVYDLLTFLEVHQRATAQLKTALEGNLPQKDQVTLCHGYLHRYWYIGVWISWMWTVSTNDWHVGLSL